MVFALGLRSLATGTGLGRIPLTLGIPRFVQGGVVKTFRCDLSPVLDIAPLSLLQQSAACAVVAARKADAEQFADVARQFSDADAEVLRWSARQILCWDSNYDNVDVSHIHGDRDHVFPISCVEPDEVVSGGGHVISMTHAPQVNEFLRKQILRLTAA